MEAYIVAWDIEYEEGWIIYGVFSSIAKAEEYIAARSEKDRERLKVIHETVDKPN